MVNSETRDVKLYKFTVSFYPEIKYISYVRVHAREGDSILVEEYCDDGYPLLSINNGEKKWINFKALKKWSIKFEPISLEEWIGAKLDG